MEATSNAAGIEIALRRGTDRGRRLAGGPQHPLGYNFTFGCKPAAQKHARWARWTAQVPSGVLPRGGVQFLFFNM